MITNCPTPQLFHDNKVTFNHFIPNTVLLSYFIPFYLPFGWVFSPSFLALFRSPGSGSGYRRPSNADLMWIQIRNTASDTVPLKGSVTRFLTLRFFHQTIPPGPLIHGLKPCWILLRVRRDMLDFRTQKSCMQFQWHRMHKKFFLGSPFKFIFFLKFKFFFTKFYVF
jgi:hypothetical protein